MLEGIELDCRILPGPPGWASCTVRAGEQSVEIALFSHALTEGIDDLVRAALNVACGDWRLQAFSMDGEPEPSWQWQLKLDLRGYGPARRLELDVTITRIDDVDTMAGVEVLRATCDPDDFCRVVLAAMRRMMSAEPREQLLERWSHFPVRAVAALETALAISADTAIL